MTLHANPGAYAVLLGGVILLQFSSNLAHGAVQGLIPDLIPRAQRGRGLGAAGMAAVVNHAQAHISPVVSLYGNNYNHAAVGAYLQVGFGIVGKFATILF